MISQEIETEYVQQHEYTYNYQVWFWHAPTIVVRKAYPETEFRIDLIKEILANQSFSKIYTPIAR